LGRGCCRKLPCIVLESGVPRGRFASTVADRRDGGPFPRNSASRFWLTGISRFLPAIAAPLRHLAEHQIGLMLTRRLDECLRRLRYPLLLSGPMDFGAGGTRTCGCGWKLMCSYLWPDGSRRSTRPSICSSDCRVATLLASSGLIHDVYNFAGRQSVTFRMSELFLAAGALLVVWRCVACYGKLRRRDTTSAPRRARTSWRGRFLAWRSLRRSLGSDRVG